MTRKPGIARLNLPGSTATCFPSNRRPQAAAHNVGTEAERHTSAAATPAHCVANPSRKPARNDVRLLVNHRHQNEAGISAIAPAVIAPIPNTLRRRNHATKLDG